MAIQHFFEQERHTRDYLLPYFHKHIPDLLHRQVLEIGCAEGGFLKPLIQLGMDARGIELSAARVAIALQHTPPLPVQAGDITDPGISKQIVQLISFGCELIQFQLNIRIDITSGNRDIAS